MLDSFKEQKSSLVKQYLVAWLELHRLRLGLVFARSAGLQSFAAGHPWQL